MTRRKFSSPLPVLLGAGRRLHAALVDLLFVTVMGDRLDGNADTPTDNFTTRFAAKMDALGLDETAQSTKTGQTGTLTRDQRAALYEMERLESGARRGARLAFADDPVKLHSEFQLGHETPRSLEAVLDRACTVLAFCRLAENVSTLKKEGWLAKETDAFAAVQKFSGSTPAQDGSPDGRIGLIAQKTVAANAVYTDTLRSQNAAWLEYPANQPGTETARACFLLDEYPLRDRSEPSGGTQAGALTASTPTPP